MRKMICKSVKSKMIKWDAENAALARGYGQLPSIMTPNEIKRDMRKSNHVELIIERKL